MRKYKITIAIALLVCVCGTADAKGSYNCPRPCPVGGNSTGVEVVALHPVAARPSHHHKHAATHHVSH
jgi:hypothetical protein